MSEWLTKATEALRGEKDPEPQPFELDCDCGTHHGGFRRRKHQRIICRSCGSSLFVLPYDSYPTPLAPAPRKKRKRKRSSAATRKADPVSTQAAVEAGRALATKAVTGVTEASAHVAARTSDAGRSLRQRISAGGMAVLRFWTPFRLVLLGILLAIGGTAWLTLHDGSQEDAIARLKQSDQNARDALADQDFATAHEQFNVAVTALDHLDRHDDSLACEIRQLHRETAVIRDLLPSTVFKVVADAELAISEGTRDDFDEDFRLHHRNRWLVLEGPVTRLGPSPDGGHYRIDFPAAIGDQQRSLVISGRLPALDALKFRDSRREVIFAGQLNSCELSSDRRSWILRLEPRTAFLWSNPANYGALGLTSSDAEQAAATNRILATQSLANGLER